MKKLFLFVFFIIVSVFIYFRRSNEFYELLNLVEDDFATVDKFYVYGNHFNIEGSFNISNYDNLCLVLKGINTEIEIPIFYSDGKFVTSDKINDGVYLDSIPINNYFIFLKSITGDDIKYYSLVNNSSYNNIQYYTVTRNNQNNLIEIKFSSREDLSFLSLCVSVSSVGNNYYDIIVDPGHGGNDSGATFSGYNEANINLDLSLKLKSELEKLGLKVGITRMDNSTIKTYGNNSRTILPYVSHAKYFISIHLNSTEGEMNYGGVEIYAPNFSNTSFASLLASSIVSSANTDYSKNQSFRISDGVYIRTFTNLNINQTIDEASNYGYIPYPVTNDTNYYFMIRETGGFITGSYMDGRDHYNKNPYYNSNIGSEGYLLELGYINYYDDLNNLINSSDSYINGIVNAFKEELSL